MCRFVLTGAALAAMLLTGCDRPAPPPATPKEPVHEGWSMENRMKDPVYRQALEESAHRQQEIMARGGPDMQRDLDAERARAREIVRERINRISK